MSEQDDLALLESFNRRNPRAFSIVYQMIYRELYLYATRIFTPLNLPVEDVIQDIFTDIWLRDTVQFPSVLYIKTFCFIALKNAYKNKIKHLGYQQHFEMEAKLEHEFSEDLAYVEACNLLYESVRLIPQDYAQIIYMYLEGWKAEDISKKLGIAIQTVYNKRREAILILWKHMVK